MRIAVTGSTGFVGSATVPALRAAGHTVHALTRRVWDLDAGPMVDPPTVDVVVHTAATVSDWARTGPSDVDQTRHVLTTFPHARLVHLSTASVYDPYVPTVRATEPQAPVTRYSTRYAAQKATVERLLAGRPDTVILRPRAIYGPGDRTVLPRLLAARRGGVLPVPGPGTVLQSLTSIENMVDAIALACSAPVTGTFNITDDAPVPLLDALTWLLAELGLAARVQPVPVAVAAPLATVSEAAYRLVRRPNPPRLTRYALSQVMVERTLDITAARTLLGYRPRPTSFRGAAGWLR